MASLEELKKIGEAILRAKFDRDRYESLSEEEREQLVPSDPENADFGDFGIPDPGFRAPRERAIDRADRAARAVLNRKG